MNILIYINTIRFLKPRQILYQIIYKIKHVHPDNRTRPSLRKPSNTWKRPCPRNQSLLDQQTFHFLNQTGNLNEIGWDGDHMGKLWRYNQHYFDDLNAHNSESRNYWHTNLLESWVRENSPGISVGWEPYPTSLRIVNWIKWYLSGNVLSSECLQSLAIQCRWLSQRIEWHILGNHLFSNAKALFFCGLFFDGDEADQWLSIGTKIINNELVEQVLPDGTHFELSPMYHSLFLEDLLDIINISNLYSTHISVNKIKQITTSVKKMLEILSIMCHPDNEISYFNDSSSGISPSPKELFSYAERLGIKSVNNSFDVTNGLVINHCISAGYIRLQSNNAVVLLDVATVGPEYLPGHAHADTLSFELSLFGSRVLVNSGTSEYEKGYIRNKERSTAAHNCVEIDGENSSEVWASFRVARRAYPIDLDVKQDNDQVSVTCSHNGYCRLRGRPIHKRRWVFSENSLEINDSVSGQFSNAVARFHLHPEIDFIILDPKLLLLTCGNKSIRFFVQNGCLNIEKSHYVSSFGKRLESKCISINFKPLQSSSVKICWENDRA